jgi:hypothetical protein
MKFYLKIIGRDYFYHFFFNYTECIIIHIFIFEYFGGLSKFEYNNPHTLTILCKFCDSGVGFAVTYY